jgi:hypothetical protein
VASQWQGLADPGGGVAGGARAKVTP